MSTTIQSVSGQRREQALSLALQGSAVSAELVGRWQDQGRRDILLAAVRSDQIVGAVWANLLPGGTGAVWPPQLVAGEPESTATRLLEAVDARLSQHHTFLAQALLQDFHCLEAARLRSGGYDHATDLVSLVGLAHQHTRPPEAAALEFEAFPPSGPSLDRLIDVVERTYEQSLDCRQLAGVCPTDGIVKGYLEITSFRPDMWRIVRERDRDVGCLLLADFAEYDECELLYMGLAPEVRRRGWGTQLAHQARWLARQAGRSRLLVHVDVRNEPALRAYVSADFVVFDRQGMFLKIF